MASAGPKITKHGNRFRVAYRENGTIKRQSFATEPEAKAFLGILKVHRAGRSELSAITDRMAAGRATPTVGEYATELISDPTLRPNSTRMYRNALKKIAVTSPDLADRPLSKVTVQDIRDLFNWLDANRDNVHRLLSRVFTAAIREGLIRVSPLMQSGIKLSKLKGRTKRERIRALTADQVEQLARAADDRYQLPIRIGAYVGLRAGEVGGLLVEDIDFDACRIYVRRNIQEAEGGGRYVGDPKTATSERDLKVDCSITDDIRDYTKRYPPLDDGTIFYTRYRNAVTDQMLTHAVLVAARKVGLYRREEGRQWPTFHKLRNTCASFLIAAKLEPKAIQTYLGHASIKMTYDLYGDLFPKADDPIAEAMGALRAAAERKALRLVNRRGRRRHERWSSSRNGR
jgi:integrase